MGIMNEHPEITEHEWYDDAFRVEQKKWGTWDSYTKDGKCIITSLTKEQCIHTTRWYLKGLQEGFTEVKTHESTVGEKL
jgi:hypothetical protein